MDGYNSAKDGLIFLFLAIANEIVYRNFSDAVWVNFKLFGIMGITFIFIFSQVFFIQKIFLIINKVCLQVQLFCPLLFRTQVLYLEKNLQWHSESHIYCPKLQYYFQSMSSDMLNLVEIDDQIF